MKKIDCTKAHVVITKIARVIANDMRSDGGTEITAATVANEFNKRYPDFKDTTGINITEDVIAESLLAVQSQPKTSSQKVISGATQLMQQIKTDENAKEKIEQLKAIINLSSEVSDEAPKTRKQKKQARKAAAQLESIIGDLEAQVAAIEASRPEQTNMGRLLKALNERFMANARKTQINKVVSMIAKLINEQTQGQLDYQSLLDEVHDQVVKIAPGDWTVEDTRDAITGYGESTPATQDGIAIALAQRKQELLETSKLRDLKEKLEARRTGPQRIRMSDEARKLVKEVNDQKKIVDEMRRARGDKEIEKRDMEKLATRHSTILARLNNQITDLKTQLKAKKQVRRVVSSNETPVDILNLRAERDKLKKDLNKIDPNDDAKQAATRKRINEVERMIATGELYRPKKESMKPTPELQKLKDRLKILNEALNDKRFNGRALIRLKANIEKLKKEIATNEFEAPVKRDKPPERRTEEVIEAFNESVKLIQLRNLLRSIKDMRSQLENGPRIPVPKEKPMDPRLMNLMIEKNMLRSRLNNMVNAMKHKTPGEKIIDVLASYRSLQASGDLPPLGRQGFINFVTHPIISTKAFGKAMIAMFSTRYAARTDIEMRMHPDFNNMVMNGLFFAPIEGGSRTEREEEMMSDFAEKIPLVGRYIIKPASRGYNTLLNQMSFEIMKNTMGWLSPHKTNYNETLKAVANKLNDFRGRGTLSEKGSWAERNLTAVSWIFFSIRNWLSRTKVSSMWHM